MLPETLAPAPEILPSLTVKVELAVGSQLPLLVTMVTLQSPSYGVWARAGTVAAAARLEANKTVAMRLMRINQIPDICVIKRLIETQCVQNLVRRSSTNCSCDSKHIEVISVPATEQKVGPLWLRQARLEPNAPAGSAPWSQTARP